MNNSAKILFVLASGWLTTTAFAQDRIHYTGKELSNPACHDGQLSPVVGVHNIQLVRANREHPDASNGNGWTYNHQPMLAYWNGQFFYQYLADPSDEHVPPECYVLRLPETGCLYFIINSMHCSYNSWHQMKSIPSAKCQC